MIWDFAYNVFYMEMQREPKDTKKLSQIALGVAVSLVLAGGFVLFFYGGSARIIGNKNSSAAILNELGIGIEGEENFVINQVTEGGESILLPDLDRPVVYPDDFPEDAQTIVSEKIEELTNSLKKKPDSFENWLNLALQRKTINDYEAAIEIWEYLGKASPNNSISFTNLGNLYHLHLKDFEKSEINFKTAIRNNPKNIHSYRSLYELYKFSYKKDTGLAEDTLLLGLKNSPHSVDLMIMLAGYYKESGEAEEASGYYNRAIEEAKKLGNDELVLILEKELKGL